MTADIPLRYVGVTATCRLCGRPLQSGHEKWCSDACRQKAYRLRTQAPQPAATPSLPARSSAKAVTVYECPSCEARLLGEQRCPDCQVWARRVGYGGRCPHCDEPVTLADLGLSPAADEPTRLVAPSEVRAMGT